MAHTHTHTHTHTHNNLSLTLNGAVRLALNPEATQKGIVGVAASLIAETSSGERSMGVFAGSSNAAR